MTFSPNSLLAAAFNQFVHSSDQDGRLRIDATKLIAAFLAKKILKSYWREWSQVVSDVPGSIDYALVCVISLWLSEYILIM